MLTNIHSISVVPDQLYLTTFYDDKLVVRDDIKILH